MIETSELKPADWSISSANILPLVIFSLIDFSRKLGDFKKIPQMLGFDDEYPAGHQKAKV